MTLPISLPESRFQYLDPESIINSPDFLIVESFLKSTKRAEIGWHYIIDLTWLYSIVKDWPRTYQIIDAGGGTGLTQFMLAELGFNVTNIDLVLTPPNQSIAQRYGTQLRRLPSYKASDYVQHMADRSGMHPFTRKLRDVIKSNYLWGELSAYAYRSRHQAWRAKQTTLPLGKIDWIQANLCCMPEIESASFDAVVSLSSLEHIPLDLLPSALNELERVLKPQARMAITTSATDAEETWFHEPSKGSCYSSKDLAALFHAQDASGLSATQILDKYQKSDYLRSQLAAFYHTSGDNGMPWGKWNPSYIPIGIWR
jgi:2-polyprenyl-3-methyl-5-hydroxy-6-metoxy-1,4-benzoquinol methylase